MPDLWGARRRKRLCCASHDGSLGLWAFQLCLVLHGLPTQQALLRE
jgi:hypothetical protein